MNAALYWHTRKKRDGKPVDRQQKFFDSSRVRTNNLVESDPVAQSGSRVGFWMIPHEGGYVKLPILESYSVKIPGWLGGRQQDLDIRFGSAFAPIWAIVLHRELLSGHFQWLPRVFNYVGIEDLFDSSSEKHDEAVMAFQESLTGRGWSFWLQFGSDGYFCGDVDSKIFSTLKGEFGGNIQRPTSVVTDFESVTKLHVLGRDGEERKVIDINVKKAQRKQKTIADVAAGITDRPYTLADVYKLVESPAAFEGMDERELSLLFSTQNIKKLHSSLEDSDKEDLVRASAIFLKYASENGFNINYGAYGDIAKRAGLTEASINRLLDLTRSNGGYMYGGLRKVGNRWVYDPSVANRMQNSAFVIKQMPQWGVSDDGYTILKFIVRSRPDRCTTGMNQTGYIKILDDSANWWTKFGRKIGGALGRKSSAMDRDVHVHCSCPDHRYRFHWVLAKMGAAPEPTGKGAAPPDKTNPSKRPSLCKHLCAVSDMLKVVPPPKGKLPVTPTGPEKEPTVSELSIMDEIEE